MSIKFEASKAQAWFSKKIEDIPSDARQILVQYSGVPPEEVVDHVDRVRREAFAVVPYPCIGQGKFLNINLSKHPLYPEILARAKAGENVVDVGCCFGTDLRKLIVDGVPPGNVYGIDVEQGFLDQGFALYRDGNKLAKSSCVAENMLDPTVSASLQPLEGEMDIANLSSFLHVFEYQNQMAAVHKVIKLMRKKPGSLIVGRQIGNETSGTYAPKMGDKNLKAFYHNAVSFQALMEQLGKETNTSWHLEAELLDDDSYTQKGLSPEEMQKAYPWLFPGTRNLRFAARLQ